MQIGPYIARTYGGNTFSRSSTRAERYLHTLERLCGIVGTDAEWMITGGLAFPLTGGEFYREHSDVDIAVHVESLPRLTSNLSRAGYFLTQKRTSGKIYPGISAGFFHKRTPRQVVSERLRNTRFVKKTGERGDILWQIHAFPYWIQGGKLHYFDPPTNFELDRPMVGTQITLPEGAKIDVIDLHYALQIKKMWSSKPKHRIDIEFSDTLNL